MTAIAARLLCRILDALRRAVEAYERSVRPAVEGRNASMRRLLAQSEEGR